MSKRGVSRSEGHSVVVADVSGQAALLKKSLKYGKSVVFSSERKGFTSKKKTAGVIGNRQRIAILVVSQQELAFVIGAPQLVGTQSQRESDSLRTMTHTAAALDQSAAISIA